MPILIAVMAFICVLVVILTAYQYFGTDKRVISQRMERYLAKRPETNLPVDQPLRQGKPLGGWRLAIRSASKYFESPRWSHRIEHKLIQAGIPLRGSEFLVICCGACLFSSCFGLIISGGKLFVAIACGFVGYTIPLLILKLKIKRRVKAFTNQLGDSLVLIANSLRTGYSFLQSIEMVSREMPKPMSEEFARVLKEMNLGIGTEDALNNLAERVNSDDLDLVVTAVIIQRQVGGNLAEVLDSISNTIRDRIKIKGQIKTLTAQGRISGVIVSLLPLVTGLMIYLVNPEYMKLLFSQPLGNAMLAVGVVSQVIGMLFIRKIVNIEV